MEVNWGLGKSHRGHLFQDYQPPGSPIKTYFLVEPTAERCSWTAPSTGSQGAQTRPQSPSQHNVQGSQKEINPDLQLTLKV